MIKAIILDCFGVLYVPIGDDFYESHVAHYANRHGQVQELARLADAGEISQDQLIISIAKHTHIDANEVRRTLVNGLIRNKALLDYAQNLRKTYKIGALSNIGSKTFEQFFTSAERHQLFDAVVLSGETSLAKPQPEIFELTCQRLGVQPAEAVMIDDSAVNCSGAIQAGLQAIVYKSFVQTKTDLTKLLALVY